LREGGGPGRWRCPGRRVPGGGYGAHGRRFGPREEGKVHQEKGSCHNEEGRLHREDLGVTGFEVGRTVKWIGCTWILWHREKDKFHMDSVAQGEG
jgi:hypothetical protein